MSSYKKALFINNIYLSKSLLETVYDIPGDMYTMIPD